MENLLRFEFWIPSISISALLCIALWLTKNLIVTRLKNSVEYEFNRKLELLKSEINKRELEIAALRSGTLKASENRLMILDQRKIDSIEKIWSGVINLKAPFAMCSQLAVMNMDAVSKRIETDRKLQNLFEIIFNNYEINNVEINNAESARPFVSPVIWATYSSLLSVGLHAVTVIAALKGGINPEGLLNYEGINKLLKTALPARTDFIDTNGKSVYPQLIEELKEKLLFDFEEMLSGKFTDEKSLLQAASIIDLANKVANDIEHKNQEAVSSSVQLNS